MEHSRINVAVIGATGSVGSSVLDICRRFPERFRVVALSAAGNYKAMSLLVREFQPELVSMASVQALDKLGSLLEKSGDMALLSGPEGLSEIVDFPALDHVVFAASGTGTLHSLVRALERGLDVSLANKESLVVGGPWVMPKVCRENQLRPVDSEHSAVWECLRGEKLSEIVRIGLTASGGPFRTFSLEDLESVTPSMALKHPTWSMGSKITIDSATLMNKGLEILEAMYLFKVPLERIEAVIHPGSLVHGYAAFRDGTVKMALGKPDMRIPAALALGFPERLPVFPPQWPPTADDGWTLEFSKIDEIRFPCLHLARLAGERLGPYPALLVGADEVAVDAFLKERIRFTEIPVLIEEVMSSYSGMSPKSLDEAIALIKWGRDRALECLRSRS